MIGRLYRVVWDAVSDRPFTYTMREWAREHPVLNRAITYPAVGLIVAGQVLLPWAFGLWAIPYILASDGVFLLVSHLWWSTKGPLIRHEADFRR